MAIYEYECEFGHQYEEQISIKEYDKNKKIQCPECGNAMERVISGGIAGFVDNGPTTIGQLGERNFKALGKVKGEEMLAKNKETKEAAQKEYLRSKGLDGMKMPDYKKMRKLATLTKEQQTRYIETGKLPY